MRIRFALLVAGSSVLAGCSSMQELNVNDDQASKVSAHVVVRPQALSRSARSEGGIEFGYEQYRGHSKQQLSPGQWVALENGTLTGPDTVDNKLRVDQMHVSYNHRFTFGRFQLEPRVGLGWMQIDMHARSANPALAGLSNRQQDVYVVGGVAPRFNFNDMLALEARYSAATAKKFRWSSDGEVVLVLRPTPALSLRAGYFAREQRLLDEFGRSDISISLQGPTVSLGLSF